MNGRVRLCLLMPLWLLLASVARADDVMEQEIDHILQTVASSDCVFIRNGKEYAAAAARDHLNLKRRRGKQHFSSADEFIERLASSSSWSGKPYAIRCGDTRQPAGDWFTAVLLEFRGVLKRGQTPIVSGSDPF